MNPWPDLRPLLDGIPWAIVGGVATRAYMPERMTRALDILVRRTDCERAWRRFEGAGYQLAPHLDAPYFVARSPEGSEVDVICAAFPWLDEALARPRHDEAGFPVLDLSYLILMKMLAARAQDLADMSRMLGLASGEEVERVRLAVATHQPEDRDDLEALILLGKWEMEDGEWRMENGEWRMENRIGLTHLGRRPTTDDRRPTTDNCVSAIENRRQRPLGA